MKSGIACVLMAVVAGCSCGGAASVKPGTGGVAARLVWGESVRTAKAVGLAPSGVATVRLIVSAGDMTTIQQDFAASAGGGTIGGVPSGSNRTLMAQGLDGSGAVTHQGTIDNITVQVGQTANAGTITMLPLAALAAPSGLSATVVSASRIDLSWIDNSTTEIGFPIERKTGASGSWVAIGVVAANITVYSDTDTSLAPGTTYYYRVRAANNSGNSSYSNESAATIQTSGGGGASGTIKLPKPGQTTSFATGDDGDLETGVAWPDPRFTDNSNGTVTDHLTGLVWLKNANCFGSKNWATALSSANGLASGACGLTDGSQAGKWRLPNVVELESLIDGERYNPALPSGHPFSAVQSDSYWSSSTLANNTYGAAWYVYMHSGNVYYSGKDSSRYVWPVRAEQ